MNHAPQTVVSHSHYLTAYCLILTRKTAIPYFLVAAIGLGTLSATGHFGGDLVYEHGAGVATIHNPDSQFVEKIPNPHS